MTEKTERTLLMIKPDGVHRRIIGSIIKRLESKGFKLIAIKFIWPSEELLRAHYSDLISKPYYSGLIKYASSGPVVPMVWQGIDVVKTGRKMLGITDPAESLQGTMRGDLSIHPRYNIVHGSDSIQSANKEIALWFSETEIIDYTQVNENWVYE